ncbi:zf-HC2 domain-containing protein [Chakrabartyella piscis]|uniref:zf-HC2 domain-containing protein n=1 Tax=Chakrabartyella piscis TaxID=2918914 RepID=UPI0029586B0F|nr:zf-HC2 domain-containing protein [Chakrabartyella piscis]
MKLNCDMTMDLVALYQDGLASESTNEAVESHLETCARCREYYKSYRIAKPFQEEFLTVQEREFAEVAKRLRARKLWKRIFTCSYILASIAAMMVLWLRLQDEDEFDVYHVK